MIGLCYTSDELLQDATALDAVIRDAFVSEFGFSLDDAIVNGTGAGQPLGILNSGSLVSVAKETGQKVATVVAENVIKMYSRLLPGSESTAVWLVNKNILPNLYTMSLAVGTGGVGIYMPANSLANQPYNTLMGCPVIPIEQAATLGTQGDIILADLTNGYILAEKAAFNKISASTFDIFSMRAYLGLYSGRTVVRYSRLLSHHLKERHQRKVTLLLWPIAFS